MSVSYVCRERALAGQSDIFNGPQLKRLGIGADLFQRIQNFLESRAFAFLDDAILRNSDQGGAQRINVFQRSQYLESQPVKIVDGHLGNTGAANGAFSGAVGIT